MVESIEVASIEPLGTDGSMATWSKVTIGGVVHELYVAFSADEWNVIGDDWALLDKAIRPWAEKMLKERTDEL